ncbi:S-layer homology domain-containing protein [Ureibacillus chungkukjangi]|uniref:S-layer homology domain-containing protein n=1 Tax=Ureibacillus chungkukjangi TaxID=1202712 RepID=UPI00384CF448
MKKVTKKKLFNLAIASALATGAVVAAVPSSSEAAALSFKDLDKSNSHYSTIMNLVDRGIIKGYEDGTFKPGQALSRQHAALILAKVLDLNTKSVNDPNFKDVPKSHPYYAEIAALANSGIIKGFPDKTFGTTKTLTRGQMAVILTNAYNLQAGDEKAPFKDLAGNPYIEQISALYANQVTTGTTPTTFSPASSVTRGQFATFVVKSEEAIKVEKVLSIKAGQLITNKGIYAIEGDLTKVFNSKNAAALKNSVVDFKFANVTSPTAALNTVAETTSAALKIVGIDSLTLVAPNAVFDASGYSISKVSVNGNNVELKNVVAEELSVGANVQLSLQGVTLKTLVVTGNAKLTLDASSKVEKLEVPKGSKLTDIITNYEQVKDAIKEVIEVDEDGNETPVNPDPGTPPGPGPGPNPDPGPGPSTIEPTVDELIRVGLSEYLYSLDGYVEPSLNATSNTISLRIVEDTTISDVREKLVEIDNTPGKIASIIANPALADYNPGTVYDALSSITFNNKQYTKADLLDPAKKTGFIEELDAFVDTNKDGATNISELVGESTTVTFNFSGYSSITYTFTITD